MEKVIKFILSSFVCIISVVVLGVIVLDFFKKISNDLENQLEDWQVELKKELPYKTLFGKIDSVFFEDRNVICIIKPKDISNTTTFVSDFYQKDEKFNVINFYSAHYDDVKELLMYVFTVCNGNDNKLVDILLKEEYDLRIVIKNDDVDSVCWDIQRYELEKILESPKIEPKEIYKKIVNLEVNIFKSNICIETITDEVIDATVKNGIYPSNLHFVNDTIEYEILIDDTKTDFEILRERTQTYQGKEEFLMLFLEDKSFRDLLNLMVIAELDLNFKFIGVFSSDSLIINIPNPILKKYSVVPYY